jgi:hypothetical protein
MAFSRKDGEIVRTTICEKDTTTVIAAGDLVTLDADGLIVKAVANSTAIAWTPNGAAAGTTKVDVSQGTNFTLTGTASAAFAKANRGKTVDITDAQLINTAASTKNVLKVGIGADTGTVGSTEKVEVRIAKPLF